MINTRAIYMNDIDMDVPMCANFDVQHGAYLRMIDDKPIDYATDKEMRDSLLNHGIESISHLNMARLTGPLFKILLNIHANPNCLNLIHEFYSQYDSFKAFNDDMYRETWDIDIPTQLMTELSLNPNVMEIAKDHKEWIDWDYIAGNEHAVPMLEKFLEGMTFETAIILLKHQEDKYQDVKDSISEDAFKHFSEPHRNHGLFFYDLGQNANAMHLIIRFKKLMSYGSILKNPSSIDILAKILVNKDTFNDTTIHGLLRNRAAGQFVVDNYHKMRIPKHEMENIHYNYKAIKEERMELNVSILFHPRFVEQLLDELVYTD